MIAGLQYLLQEMAKYKLRDCAQSHVLGVAILQNKLDVPQFEMELWLRGHTGSLPSYDGKLEKCNSSGTHPACFVIH